MCKIFAPFKADYNHHNDTIKLSFLGEFDYQKAFQYVNKIYPNFDLGVYKDLTPPYQYENYVLPGTVIFIKRNIRNDEIERLKNLIIQNLKRG